ncbi:GntR family transcriptional regulator [Streptomyces sp. NBC_01768]|uniref:GntR family transcriptional regulator n=1 Tax=Streptomyces sp. NBC_01768 TaxID=2975938 RepID=UPI002DDAAA3C|nr:GntR family transcriptional regulator [Streptomyces sp. NBC_01768]WSC32176.1 GntR family transcriptional regulator [Streptomyces sp. NBC_01768]
MSSLTPPGQPSAAHNTADPGPDPAVAEAVRSRIAEGNYVPGSWLTLRELTGFTGYSSPELRLALAHLAHTGIVHARNRRWQVPCDQPVARTRRLLTALIDNRAYPPGTELPAPPRLAPMLLTRPATVREALDALTADKILLPGGPRPRLPQLPGPGPVGALWPRSQQDVLDALPEPRATKASRGLQDLHEIRDMAQQRWRTGVCPPANVMSVQEALQGDILHRLVLAALLQVIDRPGFARLRAAAGRAMACASLPMTGPPYERMFRFTVLADALAALSDEAARSRPAAPMPHAPVGGLPPVHARKDGV